MSQLTCLQKTELLIAEINTLREEVKSLQNALRSRSGLPDKTPGAPELQTAAVWEGGEVTLGLDPYEIHRTVEELLALTFRVFCKPASNPSDAD